MPTEVTELTQSLSYRYEKIGFRIDFWPRLERAKIFANERLCGDFPCKTIEEADKVGQQHINALLMYKTLVDIREENRL